MSTNNTRSCNLSAQGLSHLVIPGGFELTIDDENRICDLRIPAAELAEAGNPRLSNGRIRIHGWSGLCVEELDDVAWSTGAGIPCNRRETPPSGHVESSEGIELHSDEVRLHVDRDHGDGVVRSYCYRFRDAGWEARFDAPGEVHGGCGDFESELGRLIRVSREGH